MPLSCSQRTTVTGLAVGRSAAVYRGIGAQTLDGVTMAQIHSCSDWTCRTIGRITPGSVIEIHYACARLPEIRDSFRGLPAWTITARFRADDRDWDSLSLSICPCGDAATGDIRLPS